jgi:hypothetical protein
MMWVPPLTVDYRLQISIISNKMVFLLNSAANIAILWGEGEQKCH